MINDAIRAEEPRPSLGGGKFRCHVIAPYPRQLSLNITPPFPKEQVIER